MADLPFAGTAPELGFRGPEVCRITGVTYRQLDYWTRTGLVEASLAPARGSGTQRLYSYTDLLEVRIIKQLLDSGVQLQHARRAVEYLRHHLGGEVASANLVIDGKRSILARSGEELVDLVRHGQGVLNILPLAGVKEALDARIHELRPGAGAPGGEVAEGPVGNGRHAAGG